MRIATMRQFGFTARYLRPEVAARTYSGCLHAAAFRNPAEKTPSHLILSNDGV